MPVDPKLLDFCATDRQRDIIRVCSAAGSNNAAADELGISKRCLQRTLRRIRDIASAKGYSPDHGLHNPPPPTHHIAKSTVHFKDGEVVQSWDRFVPLKEEITAACEAICDGISEGVKGKYKPKKFRKSQVDDDLAFCIKIGDAHLGMYAWSEETGDQNHDLKTGVDDLMEGISYQIKSAPPAHTCVIENVGDLFHANDRKSMTPGSGHALDTDSRFPKVCERAAFIMTYAVRLALQKFKHVVVINARGNHDPDAAIWMNVCLKYAFENEKRVTVVDNACKYVTFSWGTTMLLVNHGEKKRLRQYELITNRYRSEIGDCSYIYVDNGHIHHKQREEIGGIMFESWNTLTPVDAWHADQGYQASRSITGVTYDKRFGEVGRNVISLERLKHLRETE